jgi:nitric oxide reductase subunit B
MYGLMDNGTIWGHGGYLGPDFSATVLHDWALALAQQRARVRYSMDYAALAGEERAVIDAEVAQLLKTNRYDPQTGVLTVLPAGLEVFQAEIVRWTEYFPRSARQRRLAGEPHHRPAATSRPHGLLRLGGVGVRRRAAGSGPLLHEQFPL